MGVKIDEGSKLELSKFLGEAYNLKHGEGTERMQNVGAFIHKWYIELKESFSEQTRLIVVEAYVDEGESKEELKRILKKLESTDL